MPWHFCFHSFFDARTSSRWYKPSQLFTKQVDIQNATLAGGVAIGTAADLPIGPGVALSVGCFGGALTTFGYVYIQPFLERAMGIHDTAYALFILT